MSEICWYIMRNVVKTIIKLNSFGFTDYFTGDFLKTQSFSSFFYGSANQNVPDLQINPLKDTKPFNNKNLLPTFHSRAQFVWMVQSLQMVLNGNLTTDRETISKMGQKHQSRKSHADFFPLHFPPKPLGT